MLIDKIINNNIVSSLDEKGSEIVVMGRGLGYKMKPGQEVDIEKIEKVFHMDSHSESEKLKELLADMPLEHIQVSNEIIHYAMTIINKELNKSIYLTLTDHISFAIERYNKGLNFKNALLWEIKRFYHQEFLVGIRALEIIKDKISVELPEDEAGSIAMHFVNAELNTEMNKTEDITRTIQNILNIVKYHYKLKMDEESLYYERFITHLKFFLQRVLLKKTVEGGDTIFYDMVKNQYSEEHKCAEKIKTFIQQEYDYIVSAEEMTDLTIHIKRITTP